MSGETLIQVREVLGWMWTHWLHHNVHGRTWGASKKEFKNEQTGSHITFMGGPVIVDIFESDGVPVIIEYFKLEEGSTTQLGNEIRHILDRHNVDYANR